MGRPFRLFVLVVTIAALAAAQALASAPGGGFASADAGPERTGPNPSRAVVLLSSAPVATAVGSAHGSSADEHRDQIARERAEFEAWMERNVPQARVHAAYDTVLNGLSIELNGADASTLRGGPNVQEVLTPTWMSPSMDRSLEIVGWPAAFDVATTEDGVPEGVTLGAGVLVGVIDTGIDHEHEFFRVDTSNEDLYENDSGECLHAPVTADPGDAGLTSCKVIVAKVYPDDQGFSADDAFGHGTHVAGTVAGTSGTASPTGLLSGVAPGAVLGNYNVFPGDTGSASSDDIALAVEDAVLDGMDVLNLSLGGTPERGYDVLDVALRSAADAGVLSAVAAGNSGPGSETIESPGWAPWVLTAGASTNDHFLGQSATHAVVGTAGAAVGDFDAFRDPALEDAPYVWWDDIDGRGNGEACENRPLQGVDLAGDIALIVRGSCTFTTKVRNAVDVGAGGVIVFNNVAGDPIAMAHDGTDPFPTIPAVMVSNDFGTAMVGANTYEVTIGGPVDEVEGTADLMAAFSSRGPASTPDGTIIKPDMVAPGVNINSSVPCERDEATGAVIDCGFALFQGTSMATPHLAGAAAALFELLGLEDASRVQQVKSLLVNYASGDVLTDHDGVSEPGVHDQGSGRLQLDRTVGSTLWADPVSVSFGVEPRGLSVSRTVSFSEPVDLGSVAVEDTAGDGITVGFVIEGDQVVFTATRDSRMVRGTAEGTITVTQGSETLHLAYWVQFGR